MMRPLRLLRVIPFFAPSLGGSAAQARAVCRELASRGHSVSVVSSDIGMADGEEVDAWCQRDGYRIWLAATRPWQRVPPYATPALTGPLVERLAETDVLCLNVGLTLWNVAAARLARRAGIPYVYNAEGALCPHRLAMKRLRKRAFLALYERRVLRNAAALQAVTPAESEDLMRQSADPDRVHVIPNGVEVGDTPSAAAGRSFRREHGIPEDAVVILFLGRLHAVKGLDLMLAAAAPVLRADPRLVVVAAGPDEGEGRAIAARAAASGLGERFRWPGPLTGAHKSAAFAAADLFTLTSRSEGLPNAVLEAAAAGLPLWITDRCNLPEVVRYDAGTVDPPDPDLLTASLRELVRDVDGRRRRGQNARRMAQECFALPRVVDRLEELYRGLA